jgi:hypothetical protein
MGAYLDNRLHFMSAKGGWHVSFLEAGPEDFPAPAIRVSG